MAYNDGYKGRKESIKAFVYFDGTGTLSIIASYNISSITDETTGQYKIYFDTSPKEDTFAVAMSFRHNADHTPYSYSGHSGLQNRGYLVVYSRNTSNSGVDARGVNVVVVGGDEE